MLTLVQPHRRKQQLGRPLTRTATPISKTAVFETTAGGVPENRLCAVNARLSRSLVSASLHEHFQLTHYESASPSMGYAFSLGMVERGASGEICSRRRIRG